jgi:mono/diheme cytochrome c family protein/uncharacterized protein YjiS (DUF1127 family)
MMLAACCSALSTAAARCAHIAADRAARLGRPLARTMLARATRRELDALPDDVLAELGLARADIPAIIAALVPSGRAVPVPAPVRMRACHVPARSRATLRAALATLAGLSLLALASHAVRAEDAQVARGRYLVGFGGCNDCHTPGYFFGKPDGARFLGGSEVGFELPGLGVFYAPNLTPDRETGLGRWSPQEIATAFTTGKRPDGRMLAPIMPWHAFASLTRADVGAVVAFLRSLPAVKNKVPGPYGPGETPTSFVMKIVPPEAAAPAK